jgi:predicted DNA-binding transcriptional regulator AlpA
MDNKLTFTVPEAADLLGISRALAYELVGRHELPALYALPPPSSASAPQACHYVTPRSVRPR